MPKEIESKVCIQNQNIRLDQYLANLEEISSRSQAAKLIQNQCVWVNGTNQKASYKVELEDEILIKLPDQEQYELIAESIPLEIVYEDKELLVINKRAGMVVHPAPGNWNGTLVNALLAHCKEDLSMGVQEQRPGIVHRIDKDTSGLLVVAKNNKSHEALAKQFQQKSTDRLYWAVCFGVPHSKEKTIESFLARHPKDRKKFSSHSKYGKKAITKYRVLAEYQKDLSLIEFQLFTGRTHQIRVHTSENQHPIIGDTLYSNLNRVNSVQKKELRNWISNMNRFALHAYHLAFDHPSSSKRMSFRVPPPNDLIEILDLCHFLEYL